MKIYPKVEIRTGETKDYVIVEMKTILRKKYKALWYRELIWKSYHVLKFKYTPDTIVNLLNEFHGMVYKSILFGAVNTSLIDADGNTVFTVDKCQKSEEERLNLKSIKIYGKKDPIPGRANDQGKNNA